MESLKLSSEGPTGCLAEDSKSLVLSYEIQFSQVSLYLRGFLSVTHVQAFGFPGHLAVISIRLQMGLEGLAGIYLVTSLGLDILNLLKLLA